MIISYNCQLTKRRKEGGRCNLVNFLKLEILVEREAGSGSSIFKG